VSFVVRDNAIAEERQEAVKLSYLPSFRSYDLAFSLAKLLHIVSELPQ